eukprot:529633_1
MTSRSTFGSQDMSAKETTMEGILFIAVALIGHTSLIWSHFNKTALYEISKILNTGLTKEQLRILTDLCEMGVNPEALAKVVQQLRTKQNQQPQILNVKNFSDSHSFGM